HFLGLLLECFARSSHQRHLRATRYELARNSSADASASAGDDCVLPLEIPVHCQPLSFGGSLRFTCPLHFTLELNSALIVLNRPAGSRESKRRGGMQRPLRIGQMRTANCDEVSPSRGNDRIHLICVCDVSTSNGRNACFVPYAIC